MNWFKLWIGIAIFVSACKPLSAQVRGNFNDYSWVTVTDSKTGMEIFRPLGTIVLSNDLGQVVGEDKEAGQGKITIADGFLAVKAKEKTSFRFKPEPAHVAKKWETEKPTIFPKLTLDKDNRWTIEDSAFVFLVEVGGNWLSRWYVVSIPESIVRASIIALPKGEFSLFGYSLKTTDGKASVTFSHGEIVEHTNCVVRRLPEEKATK